MHVAFGRVRRRMVSLLRTEFVFIAEPVIICTCFETTGNEWSPYYERVYVTGKVYIYSGS